MTTPTTSPGGRFHFHPWLRRGIGADAGQPDGASLPDRSALDVTLDVTAVVGGAAQSEPSPPQMTVHLYGPGDIIGIDPRHVIRTEPRDQTVNFEPNYLAGIEFDYPDFPWLFTPALPNGSRLRPFVTLIVLKASEYATPSVPPNPLPAIDVQDMSALQPLDDAWNWAHTQVSGDGDLTATISSNPAAVISRVLCPRRLDPETSYTAFLVPAFEIGRQAGLGMDVSGLHTSDPAWTSDTTAPLRLPVYYQFSFGTSDAGDFESLVRKLTPTILPADVGSAPMAVDQPGAGIPSAGGPLGLQGALCSASASPTPWSGPDQQAFQTAMAKLVNLTAAAGPDDPDNPLPEDPHIVPPFYGKWQAAAASVSSRAARLAGHAQPGSARPRGRGHGHPDRAGAADRADGIGLGSGRRGRGGEPAAARCPAVPLRDVLDLDRSPGHGDRSHAAHAHRSGAGPDAGQPAHGLRHDHGQPGAAAHGLRRVPPGHPAARPGRPARGDAFRADRAARRQDPAARAGQLGRGPGGSPAPPPGHMTSIDQVSAATEASALPATLPGWLAAAITWLTAHLGRWLPALVAVLGLAVLALGVVLALVTTSLAAIVPIIVVAIILAAALLAAAFWLARVQQVYSAGAALSFAGLTEAAIQGRAGCYRVQGNGPSIWARRIRHAHRYGARGAGRAAGDGRHRARGHPGRRAVPGGRRSGLRRRARHPGQPAGGPALDIAALSATVLSRLSPAATVAARLGSIVRMPGGPWYPADPLQPIMAAPSFPEPMYEPLRDLNQDYLLPGVELIPPDTLGAVVGNHAFIESYMVGLNHEMARQLLWNGYPTDQRGSYFRQFWDVSGYLPQAGDPTNPAQLAEALLDIPPINTWPLSRALGDNENQTSVVADNVVLLVRGELLRRYPNTVIFAGKAKAGDGGDNGRVLDETDERFPIFRGTLTPDITFFGFNLSVADAVGGTAASPLGFFFVFQEQPTEPRFGLEPQSTDPVTQWEDLAWTNFGGAVDDAGETAARPAVAPALQPAAGGFGVGQGTLSASAVSSVFPNLAPTEISRYRVASTVFAGVLASFSLPPFLSASDQPGGVALSGVNPEDSALAWGVDAAQTAAITIRMPFRIMVHADTLLPGTRS